MTSDGSTDSLTWQGNEPLGGPWDVVVVGAGPAGSATARALARANCRVLLCESSAFGTPRVGESLAPGVQRWLRELGTWEQFLALDPLPSHGTRSAWGAPELAEHSHLMTPYLCGWHVDRLALDRMLAESAQAAGATLLPGAHVLGIASRGHGFRLRLRVPAPERTAELDADFVIDATGRRATLARELGAERWRFDALVAVAAAFEDPQAEQNGYTLVETCRDGWWYSAPAGRGRSVAMLMTDGDITRPGGRASAWQAALELAPHTTARLASARRTGEPRSWSAVSQRVARARNEQRSWLCVGDAALAVDPISGSGVIRALRTASEAAAALLALRSGESDALMAYEYARNTECTNYLHERALYYTLEERFSDAPFWQRRKARAGRSAEDLDRRVST